MLPWSKMRMKEWFPRCRAYQKNPWCGSITSNGEVDHSVAHFFCFSFFFFDFTVVCFARVTFLRASASVLPRCSRWTRLNLPVLVCWCHWVFCFLLCAMFGARSWYRRRKLGLPVWLNRIGKLNEETTYQEKYHWHRRGYLIQNTALFLWLLRQCVTKKKGASTIPSRERHAWRQRTKQKNGNVQTARLPRKRKDTWWRLSQRQKACKEMRSHEKEHLFSYDWGGGGIYRMRIKERRWRWRNTNRKWASYISL